MATNVTMPKLGLTMETGKILEWKAAEGGEVKQGSILLVVETEKITYEVEAPATGLLHIIVKAEEEVPVAELIAQIAADKAELDSLAAGGAPAAAAPAAAARGSCSVVLPQPLQLLLPQPLIPTWWLSAVVRAVTRLLSGLHSWAQKLRSLKRMSSAAPA